MFDEITSLNNLYAAWYEFRCGKRDRTDVMAFERHLENNIFALHEELTNGTYRHGPYHKFHVFDPKHRVIHKATVRDRLVHHAVHRVLLPVFEPSFIYDSYSCRDEKGTHAAVRRLEVFARRVSRNYAKPCWVLKFDVRKFFDSVDHEVLLGVLGNGIVNAAGDGTPAYNQTIKLLEIIVGSYRTQIASGGGLLLDRNVGLPIGNLTSQLFANVYMNAFDHVVKENLRRRYYIRYTDDAVILADNREDLVELLPWIRVWLLMHRRLELHPHKVEIRKLRQGVDFLGYVTLPHYRVLRTKTKQRMLRRVNETNITSYVGLLGHCKGHSLTQQLLNKTPTNDTLSVL